LLAAHYDAENAPDIDRIMATFAEGAEMIYNGQHFTVADHIRWAHGYIGMSAHPGGLTNIRSIRDREHYTDDEVIVAIEDKGPGVPKSEREKIWDPYVRLSRATESAAGGSGIGLSIVRELVRLHDGTTWVEDAPGGGARFVIQFPRIIGLKTGEHTIQVQRKSAGVGA